MSRPVSRVLTLLELLQSGGVRTVAELADRLGVGERTVRRYVDHLLDLDVPVESVRGRYGGYRLAPGHRLPPLMLTDDEALAVLLGLVAGRRTGITAAAGTAGETAAAKVRRVLPERLRHRLDAVLDSLTFTTAPAGSAAPEADVLLPVADAVRHHRPLAIRYTGGRGGSGESGDSGGSGGSGGSGERTVYPYGLVAHAGRWYVTGRDLSAGAERTFRLDRIDGARVLPGTFEPPPGPGPAERVLTALATAPYRHEVTVRVRGTAEEVRARLPRSVAVVAAAGGEDEGEGGGESEEWCRVEIRAERLDWLPGLLASLDRPFVVERPDELRGLVADLAGRLMDAARGAPPPRD
ncbi:transcriptional regulator [Streptomyces sp. CS113]|uniref:helix-turn-helix transcriptional regulator n=1 Tax=Streptomyces sp. CS113 TaxID=1982761 RepID=UPI000B40BC69|nr:WYL domain-containing protein [Streptomyces sp. CS113]OWA09350.1 transcriptional regulator [Streptomyces sp. CS113]